MFMTVTPRKASHLCQNCQKLPPIRVCLTAEVSLSYVSSCLTGEVTPLL